MEPFKKLKSLVDINSSDIFLSGIRRFLTYNESFITFGQAIVLRISFDLLPYQLYKIKFSNNIDICKNVEITS
jgi:hypothetical protein